MNEFFLERNWSLVSKSWKLLITKSCTETNKAFLGDNLYGVTDIDALHCIGIKEFQSNDPRYKRKTFALRIGYNGVYFKGYQMQKGQGVSTVEDAVYAALGNRTCVAAGRTDKDVSAISQIISFSTYDDITAEDILLRFNGSDPCKEGRLVAFHCARVPRRFHALFSATWRRYIYMFPLKTGSFGGYDVDISFVDKCFKSLEGKSLGYNAFAYKENRSTGEGNSDICTLFRSRAEVIMLEVPSDAMSAVTLSAVLCVELVGSRFLRRMVRNLVATAIRESINIDPFITRNHDTLLDIALSGDRSRTCEPVPGVGLALAGVGYDLSELAKDKQRRKNHGENEDKKRSKKILSNSIDMKQIPSLISWRPFVNELVSFDDAKLFDPERRFHFSAPGLDDIRAREDFDIVIPQNAGNVGTIVWDAEVLLAHFIIDKNIIQNIAHRQRGAHVNCDMNKNAPSPAKVLELGAGTALAAMVCRRLGARVMVQDVESVLCHTRHCLETNGLLLDDSISTVSGRWGGAFDFSVIRKGDPNDRDDDAIRNTDFNSDKHVATDKHVFDLVIMADVLYHIEDFEELVQSISRSVRERGGRVIIAYEKRRCDVSAFHARLDELFSDVNIFHCVVSKNNGEPIMIDCDDDDSGSAALVGTQFYIYDYTR